MSGGCHSARSTRLRCYVLGALLAMHVVPVAQASRGVPTIVLEAHVGQRPADAAAAIEPVLDELERLGFAARPKSIEKLLQGRAPRPGVLDEGKTVADIKRLIALGRFALDKGRLKEAEAALREAVDLIRRNPALLVLDTNNEKVSYSAFVGLAVTLAKLKRDSEATDVMMELLRMSSTPIPQADYGPKAEEIHQRAEARAQGMGRGSLAISVTDSRAMIFLNGRFSGVGKVAMGDLIPGTHYVLVQVPGTGGLQYVRTVRANEPIMLDINWQVESMLRLEDRWAGFNFATEIARAQEAVYASDLAHRLGGADVIVIGTTQLNGVSFVVGMQYPANGGPPIGAIAPVNGGERLLRSLARYLYDGTTAAGLRVLPRAVKDVAPTVALVHSATASPRSSLMPKIVVGAGALVVTAAGIVYARSSYDPMKAPREDGTDGRDRVVSVMVGGSLVLGGGVYLWSRESRSASALTAGMLATGVASIVAGAELYLVDQDPGPFEPKYIRNTAVAGVVTAGAGLALTGAGLWLLRGERASPASRDMAARPCKQRLVSWAPVVSMTPSEALVGGAGSF
jgi:hypothetical protein